MSSKERSPEHADDDQNRPANEPRPADGDDPPRARDGRDVAAGNAQEQLEAARAERDENKDKWLRAEAELDNVRKRLRKEMEDVLRFQALGVARDLLPGLDNLERAIVAGETAGSVDDLLQGIRMVAQQFRDVFARHGIEPIDAVGEPFDPNLHEALQQVPTAEHPPMTVIQDVETGYKLHDRVVRPSKVIVAAAPPEPQE